MMRELLPAKLSRLITLNDLEIPPEQQDRINLTPYEVDDILALLEDDEAQP